MADRKVIIFMVLICFILSLKSKGQDVAYSQFYANPLYLNPALAGATLSPRISMNYRNQWPSLNQAFTTYNVSYDHYVDAVRGAFGVVASMDRISAGLMSSSMVQLMYSYHLRASRSISINMAVSGGFYQKAVDWNSLVFEDPNSFEMPVDRESVFVPDLGFGAVLGYKDIFYVGAALHHLTQPTTSFYEAGLDKLYRKLTIHAGVNINFGTRHKSYSGSPPSITLSPAIVYIHQYQFNQFNVGLNLTIYPFVVGVWYRNNIPGVDAVIALLGFQYRGFQFGYSYDVTISKLTNATGGAHEVSLGYRFKPSKLSRRTIERNKEIPCPRF